MDALWGVAYALDATVLRVFLTPQNTNLVDPIPANLWCPDTSVQSRLSDIEDTRLKSWKGPAAEDFRLGFLKPFAENVTPQSEIAIALALAATAQRNLRAASHADIWDIGQKTLQALDALHACHWGRDFQVTLTILTVVVGTFLAIPTDGLSLAGAYGLVNALQGLGSTAGEVRRSLGGRTVSAVISSMVEAINSLLVGVDEQEQNIGGFLDRVATQLPTDHVRPPQPPQELTKLATANADALTDELYPSD